MSLILVLLFIVLLTWKKLNHKHTHLFPPLSYHNGNLSPAQVLAHTSPPKPLSPSFLRDLPPSFVPFSLLYLQLHTHSWLLPTSINMYENPVHSQRPSPQFPAFLLSLSSSHSQAPTSTSYRNCFHAPPSIYTWRPSPPHENTHFQVAKGSLVTKSSGTFLSLNYLPFILLGAFGTLSYALLFWKLFFLFHLGAHFSSVL